MFLFVSKRCHVLGACVGTLWAYANPQPIYKVRMAFTSISWRNSVLSHLGGDQGQTDPINWFCQKAFVFLTPPGGLVSLHLREESGTGFCGNKEIRKKAGACAVGEERNLWDFSGEMGARLQQVRLWRVRSRCTPTAHDAIVREPGVMQTWGWHPVKIEAKVGIRKSEERRPPLMSLL